MQRAADTIRYSPSVIVIPALLFLVLTAVGLWAVVWSSNNKDAEILRDAIAAAQSTVMSLELSLRATLQPALVMASFVRQHPNWGDLSPRFPSFAGELYSQASFVEVADRMLSSIRVSPFGVITSTVPPTDPYFAADHGVDMFSNPAHLSEVLNIIRQNATTLSWTITSAVSKVIIRTPVFIGDVSQTELFGQSNDTIMQAACDAACYRGDIGAKFWGFTSVVMDVNPIMQGTHSSLVDLMSLGYVYRIYRPANLSSVTPDIFIGGSAGDGHATGDMHMEVIQIPNAQWYLFMAPAKGWRAPWTAGLLAAAVLLSALAAYSLACVMISRRQHELLLLSLVPLSVVERVRRDNSCKLYRQDTLTLTSSGTPADRILDMMSQLLRGVSPSLQDVILVKTDIMQSFDLYAPTGVEQNIRDAVHDTDVGAALVALVAPNRIPMPVLDMATRCHAPSPLTLPEAQCKVVAGDGPAEGRMGKADDLRSVLHDIMTVVSRCSDDGTPSSPFGSWMTPSIAGSRRSSATDEGPGSANSNRCMVSAGGKQLHGSSRPSTLGTGAGAAGGEGPVGANSCSSAAGGGPGVWLPAVPSLLRSGSVQHKMSCAPTAPMLDDVERLLLTADSWTFDVFQLDEATGGRPLSTLAFFLISRGGLIKTFDLPPKKLVRYLVSIENGYSEHNPYHNRKHAADVLQSMHRILHESGMRATSTHTGYVDDLTLLACYLAATVHDYEHGGMTNDYLIASEDQIALTYNDKSPLENHHLSAACKKMYHRDSNFSQNLKKAQFVQLRKMLIDLVMATDMKQHFSIVSQFGALHRLSRHTSDGGNGPAQCTLAAPPSSEQGGGAGTRDRPAAPPVPPSQHTVPPKVPLDSTERLLSIQMALKLADLGHLSAPLHVHLRWVAALEEEFFRQGDAEKACMLPVSPLFDRKLPGVTKSQVGFFDVVVLPAFKNFACVFPGSKPMLAAAQANHRHWKGCQLAVVTTDGSSSTAASPSKAGTPPSHHLLNSKIPQQLQDPAGTDSSKIQIEIQ
ncbi:MAG: hypothetical protein WDW36_009929 [Sanguina aurantia]